MKKNGIKSKAKSLSKKKLKPVSKTLKRKTTTTGDIYATYGKAKKNKLTNKSRKR